MSRHYYPDASIMQAARVIALAYRLQELHTKIVYSFADCLERDAPFTFGGLARRVGCRPDELRPLGRRYPETRRIIIDAARRLKRLSRGKKADGSAVKASLGMVIGLEPSKRDPLLERLRLCCL